MICSVFNNTIPNGFFIPFSFFFHFPPIFFSNIGAHFCCNFYWIVNCDKDADIKAEFQREFKVLRFFFIHLKDICRIYAADFPSIPIDLFDLLASFKVNPFIALLQQSFFFKKVLHLSRNY